MLPYLVLLVFLVVVTVIEKYLLVTKRERIARWAFLFAAIVLILFAVLRNETVGADYANYSMYYKTVVSGGDLDGLSWEPGLKLIYSLSTYIGLSFHQLLAIISFFVVGSYSFVIYKMSKFPVMSLLIYFCIFNYAEQFNIVRQSMAMAFGMLAVGLYLSILPSVKQFLYDKTKPSRKTILGLFAILALIVAGLMFHKSIIILPFIMVCGVLRFKRESSYWKLALVFGCISLILFALKPYIVDIFAYGNLDYKLPLLYLNKPAVIIYLTMTALIYKVRKDTSNLSRGAQIIAMSLYNIFFFTLMIQALFIWVPNLYRFYIYSNLFLIVMVPLVLTWVYQLTKNIPGVRAYLVIDAIFILGLVLFAVYSLNVNTSAGVIPYTFSR